MNRHVLGLLSSLIVLWGAACQSPEESVVVEKSRSAELSVENSAARGGAPGLEKERRQSRAKIGRVFAAKTRGRTIAVGVPVAITVPTSCDWISPASNWRDRKDALCGALERQPGLHRVVARIGDLDTRVADEIADAEAFDWGPRLLNRQAAPLIVGDDVYVSVKGGAYTPCSTVGPTDPCGPDLWDERAYGVRAYRWEHGSLVLKWEYYSDWTPPGVNYLSQSWEPVFQPSVSGLFIYVQEGRGQISKIDRATGLVVATISAPESTDRTYTAAPPAVGDGGVVFHTAFTISANDPYGTDASWLIRTANDGTQIVKNVNELVANQAPTCQLFFSFANPRPALPWPPAPGAQAPFFPSGSWRFAVNATPAISLNGQTVAVVARSRQCGESGSLLAVNARTLVKHWEYNLDHTEADGCGPTRNPDGSPSMYLTPDTAQPGQNTTLECRVGSTLGVAVKKGSVPGNFVNELSVSAPVSLPGDAVALGSYRNHDNERGATKVIGFNGAAYRTFNFGWNYNPAVIYSNDLINGTKLLFLDSHYDNGPYGMLTYGLYTVAPLWEKINTNHKKCLRSGSSELYDCESLPPFATPGPGQSLKRAIYNGNAVAAGVRDVVFQSSLYPFVPRQPAVTGERNVWVSGTDGVARLISGESGKELDALQIDSAMGQADVPVSLDASGRAYFVQNGNLVVVGKR